MELIIEGLTKKFDDFTAVNRITYRMNKGVYGLLGVNGAGKTTLMRMLCTLLNRQMAIFFVMGGISLKWEQTIETFLLIVLGVACYFAISDVSFVDEKGEEEYGLSAIKKYRAAKQEWAGELTEDKIAKVIEDNMKINATEEQQSEDVQKNNIAYGLCGWMEPAI